MKLFLIYLNLFGNIFNKFDWVCLGSRAKFYFFNTLFRTRFNSKWLNFWSRLNSFIYTANFNFSFFFFPHYSTSWLKLIMTFSANRQTKHYKFDEPSLVRIFWSSFRNIIRENQIMFKATKVSLNNWGWISIKTSNSTLLLTKLLGVTISFFHQTHNFSQKTTTFTVNSFTFNSWTNTRQIHQKLLILWK